MKFVIKEKKIQNYAKVTFIKRKNICQIKIKDKSNKSNITKNKLIFIFTEITGKNK